MKALSGLEIAEIVSEIQELAGSRVDNVYQVEKRIFFELYLGRRSFLVVEAGKRLNISEKKEAAPKIPPGFCTLLRKRLKGLRLTEIVQHEFDRVVVLKFQGKETYFLVAELFAKGNLILCDSDMKIVQPLKVEFWRGRSIKPKTDYIFPPSGPNLLTIDKSGFLGVLEESKKNLVSTLVSIGLGKRGEEVCDKLKIEREIEIPNLNKNSLDIIWKEVKALVDEVPNSKGLNKIVDQKFSEGIEEEHEEEVEKKEETAKKKWEKHRKDLETAVVEIEKGIKSNQKMGEWIQANNLEVQKILDGVKKDRKAGVSKAEIEKKYKVVLKGEKVVIEGS